MLKLFVCCVAVAAASASLLGGYSEVEPTDDGVQDVIDFAQTSLNARSNGIFLRRVTKVLSVKRQLVNGMNYEIEFMNGMTKCTRQQEQMLSSCEMTDGKEQQCKVRVYVSFSGDQTLTDFKCKNADKVVKRAGQIQKVDNPDVYVATAIRALAMSNAALKNIKVISARTQVVAGQKIMLDVVGDSSAKEDTRCEVDVWSRPWLSDDEGFKVTKFSCRQNVVKRMAKRVGGVQKVDNPEMFVDTAIRALSMSNAVLKNIKVVSARTQVVAGEKIMLEVVGDSDQKEDTRCEVDVWSRPWLSDGEDFKVTKFSCSKNVQRRAVLGGVTGGISQDLQNKAQYLDTARIALSMTNSALTDLEVVRARTQTVAGTNYYLTVRGKEFGEVKECEMVVWSRPWLTGAEAFKLTDFKCSAPSSKRALKVGGFCAGCVSQEVDNPDDYMGLYTRVFGLANSNMDINNTQILSVRTQVVAGTKYYMKVRTSEAGEPRICDVQFVEAPWMTPQISHVTFDCQPEA